MKPKIAFASVIIITRSGKRFHLTRAWQMHTLTPSSLRVWRHCAAFEGFNLSSGRRQAAWKGMVYNYLEKSLWPRGFQLHTRLLRIKFLMEFSYICEGPVVFYHLCQTDRIPFTPGLFPERRATSIPLKTPATNEASID